MTSAHASASRLEHSWWRSRQFAVLELGCFVAEGNKTVAWSVAALVGHANVCTRCAALQVLANLGPGSNPEVANWLVEALDDADLEVRNCAVHSLSCIARNGALCQETADDVVNCLVSDRPLSGREAARGAVIAIAAASQGSPPLLMLDEPMEDLIVKYLPQALGTSSCPLVVETLGQAAPQGHSPSVSMLYDLISASEDPKLRLAVLKALDRVASQDDVDQHQLLFEAAEFCSTECDESTCEVAREILERLEQYAQINGTPLPVLESSD